MTVNGGMAAVERDGDSFYFVLPLRNVGAGLGVLQGWYLQAGAPTTLTPGSGRPDPGVFRRQLRDLYVPAGDVGFWQGAVREPDDVFRPGLREAVDCGARLTLDLLYGDHEGGQSTVSRFVLVRTEGTDWQPQVARHWTLEGHDPRD